MSRKWDKYADAEHCYYRIFASPEKDFAPCIDNQIASTVAESLDVVDMTLNYKVLSVDRYGNTILNT